jgi:hypothetical protein
MRKAGVGAAGARALAGHSWPRLEALDLWNNALGDAGAAALARGEWLELTSLELSQNGMAAPPTLEELLRWAPKVTELRAH